MDLLVNSEDKGDRSHRLLGLDFWLLRVLELNPKHQNPQLARRNQFQRCSTSGALAAFLLQRPEPSLEPALQTVVFKQFSAVFVTVSHGFDRDFIMVLTFLGPSGGAYFRDISMTFWWLPALRV